MQKYKKIKAQLIERKQKLAELLGKIEKSARRKLEKDSEQQAIDRENEEVLTSLDDSLNEEFEEITNALNKLKQGTYGNCDKCGREIALKRLEAIPYANLCINCAS